MMSETTLIAFLKEMEMAASELQGRLVARDTEGILEALKKQESVVEKLSNLPVESVKKFTGISSRNVQVRGLLRRCQSMLRTNRALSSTFLQVINRTLGQLSGAGSSYSDYGSAMRSNRPVLISQQG